MLNIWKIDHSAIHDGPGIRTAVYFKGCPLKCIWCSNPEGQTPDPNLVFIQIKCIGCGLCIEKCPTKAIEFKEHDVIPNVHLQINRAKCNLCGDCVLVCPTEALEILGKKYSIAELLHVLEKDRPIHRKSGGGVTLTGGEPLFQPESITELVKLCCKRGIHIVMETCAYGDEETFKRILEKVNWLFIDLKHMDPKTHFRLTGKYNDLIHNNVRLASAMMAAKNRVLVIRMVVVPGINDGNNIYELAKFLHSLPYIENVELLPYHRYGTHKYNLLNRSYDLINLEPPSSELMEKCQKIFEKYRISAFWKDSSNLQCLQES
jgi:pyruvate formate lyase activating enzyme